MSSEKEKETKFTSTEKLERYKCTKIPKVEGLTSKYQVNEIDRKTKSISN